MNNYLHENAVEASGVFCLQNPQVSPPHRRHRGVNIFLISRSFKQKHFSAVWLAPCQVSAALFSPAQFDHSDPLLITTDQVIRVWFFCSSVAVQFVPLPRPLHLMLSHTTVTVTLTVVSEQVKDLIKSRTLPARLRFSSSVLVSVSIPRHCACARFLLFLHVCEDQGRFVTSLCGRCFYETGDYETGMSLNMTSYMSIH